MEQGGENWKISSRWWQGRLSCWRVLSQSQHHQVNHHQPRPPQKRPRCEATKTKFCYYNNYSLSQPGTSASLAEGIELTVGHWGMSLLVMVAGRAKQSKASPSSTDSETGRTQPLQPPRIPSQNSGISPVNMISPMNSLCFGGGNLSCLGASHPQGINQAAENLSGDTQFNSGFGGGSALNIPFLEAR